VASPGKTPRLLDLFCGAGGAAVGYHRAGFEVVGVDVAPQPNYPFEFVLCDALEYLRIHSDWIGKGGGDDFAAIHASPPCQRWSTKTKEAEKHPDLITPLLPLLEQTGLPYVIENVTQSPLRFGPGRSMGRTIMLCGSSFGLGVRRHRLFAANFDLMGLRCHHGRHPKIYRLYDHGKWYMSDIVHVFGTGGGKGREHWQEAMGIDWTDDTDELREAIPPAYTEFIGHQLLQPLAFREVERVG